MIQRRSQPPWLRNLATAFVVLWSLVLGCNPELINALGGNTTTSTDTPDGYIMILLMNGSTTSIQAVVDITKENGSTKQWTLTTGPLGVYMFAQDCEVAAVQFDSFGYTSTGGTIVTPANLGVLTAGQSINCGQVIAVNATGTPPTFSVQVY